MLAETNKSAPLRAAPTGVLFFGIGSLGATINPPVRRPSLAEWPSMAMAFAGIAAGLVASPRQSIAKRRQADVGARL